MFVANGIKLCFLSLQCLQERHRVACVMASTETSPLNVEELNVTSAVLVAAAHHYGQACRVENDAFMKCRQEKKDPRACLEEGRRVTQCAIKL